MPQRKEGFPRQTGNLRFSFRSLRRGEWTEVKGGLGLPQGLSGKESACNAGDAEGVGSIPAGKVPWRRKWQPTPVVLPAKSHGQRSLTGYSPWGRQEADNTEATEQARTKRERESRLEEASELGEQEQQD